MKEKDIYKLLKQRGLETKKEKKIKEIKRAVIKLRQTPTYEGGKVALLNVGGGFFKR